MVFDTSVREIEVSKTKEEVALFWKRLGYIITDSKEDVLKAKRGHIIHNFYTFNMKKLETYLVVQYNDDLVNAAIRVNTVGQVIIKQEAKLWPLELTLFESFLKGETLDKKAMAKYEKKRKLSQLMILTIIFLVAALFSAMVIFLLK